MNKTNTLPVIQITTQVRNPDWAPVYDLDNKASNMDSYYIRATVDAEILTVHLNKGTMRVRFTWMDRVQTIDVTIPSNMKVSVTIGNN